MIDPREMRNALKAVTEPEWLEMLTSYGDRREEIFRLIEEDAQQEGWES